VERLNLQNTPELATGPMMNPWERLQRSSGRRPAVVLDPSGMPLSPAAAAFRSRIQVEPVPGSRPREPPLPRVRPAGGGERREHAGAGSTSSSRSSFASPTSSEATGWLSDRLKEQQAKIDASERALQDYREKEGLVGRSRARSSSRRSSGP
jgi:hypothetical protein